ncbi:SCP-like protein [Ancylostoma ceylanicum]|uniref:SCP-like protein n=1 Tax=Ancylostoma ceylanicum TaxID=53326 RepID=A0A0D6LB01_9BILA|nr:SCP-like protein [Ancylostoma ceylanicum]
MKTTSRKPPIDREMKTTSRKPPIDREMKTTSRKPPIDREMKTTSRKPNGSGSDDEPSSTVSMCPGSKITEKARNLFLALHNEKRRSIALGKAPNNVGFLGPAKNMYKMEWKCEYEKFAQTTVDSCNANGALGPASNGISGNFQGTVMWEKGPACQQDADCTTYSGSTCDNGLCVAGGGSGMAVGGTNKICPKNSHMNDEAREKFLERHNSLRSSLAKGEQEDPLGVNGFAPKAARMRKMVWDCEIEYNSQKHASSCQYAHSPPSARPGLGQNLYFTEQITLGVALAAAQASNSWWAELKTFGVPPENRITEAVYYRKGKEIGHYSQMAWQNSYKLGCGISWCKQFTYVVCEYGPGGNTMGELIYQLGSPCSTDEDCQCSGCKCSKEEALCIMP